MRFHTQMANQKLFQTIISEHIQVASSLPLREIEEFAKDINKTLSRGGKIIFFGNGGSAAQASHWAEEFIGRFVKKRKPLPAMALGANLTSVTGIANDYGFEQIFAREIESLADKKDLAVAISTSGNSKNVINGLQASKNKKIKTWVLTGNTNSRAKQIANRSLSINSGKTARIQELHALVIHMVLELLEYKKQP